MIKILKCCVKEFIKWCDATLSMAISLSFMVLTLQFVMRNFVTSQFVFSWYISRFFPSNVSYQIFNFSFFSRFRFDIKDAPRFGRLERLRGHGKWASTKRFFSRQLEKGKVRYVHTKGNPSTDSFSFTVTVPANSGSGSNSGSIPGGGFMAYTEDTFKIDIISNIIRVSTKLLVNDLDWFKFATLYVNEVGILKLCLPTFKITFRKVNILLRKLCNRIFYHMYVVFYLQQYSRTFSRKFFLFIFKVS